MPVFGYLLYHRATGHPTVSGPDDPAARLHDYAKQERFALQEVFTDGPDTAALPWLSRPGGRRLAERLTPGCQVVVPDAATIYTRPADLLAVIESFRAQEITLHIASLKSPGDGEEVSICTADESGHVFETALRAVQELASSSRGEAVRDGMQRRKQEGRRHCRHAGYGFRWRRGKRVPDAEEQAVIARIVEWREEGGCSWQEIAAHLLRCGVSIDGREWSPSRVRRAFLAELRRRAAVR